MMRARALVAVAIAFAALAFGAEARADETPETKPDNRARAQQLFDSALADAEAGNFGAACPKFLASQEADPKTSTLLNLANCYEKNGQTASAWGAFREAEVLARKAGRSDWETIAHDRAQEIEPKLVRLSIALPDAHRVDGLVVMRDGVRIAPGEWGVAIPVDPGEHVVGASAEGHVPWEERVAVTQADVTVEIPRLERDPEPPPPAPQTPLGVASAEPAPRGWSPMKTTGAILSVAGLGGLITSGALALVANGSYDDARAQCRDGTRGCPSGAVADADEAYGLALGATVVFAVGAALVAGGATLLVIDHGKQPAPAHARVGVGPRGLRLAW